MKPKPCITLLFGAVFSVTGLYIAFRNVPLASLRDYVEQVNYLWLLPSFVSFIMAYFVRTVRWQRLLLSAGRPRLASAYHSLMISMMVNCLLPARFGELARPVVLKKLEDIPIASSLATLGVERLLDLATLLVLLVPTLLMVIPEADTVIPFGNQQLTRNLLTRISYLSLLTALLLLLMITAISSKRLRTFFSAVFDYLLSFTSRIGLDKMSHALERLKLFLLGVAERGTQGVKAVCHWKGFLSALFMSLLFWTFNALTFYFLSVGSPGIDLSFFEICGVMVVICFFIALPSVPGFWGLWEAAGVFALSFLGIGDEVAAGYSLFTHAFSLIPIIVAGWLSCLSLGFRWQALTKDETSQAA